MSSKLYSRVYLFELILKKNILIHTFFKYNIQKYIKISPSNSRVLIIIYKSINDIHTYIYMYDRIRYKNKYLIIYYIKKVYENNPLLF